MEQLGLLWDTNLLTVLIVTVYGTLMYNWGVQIFLRVVHRLEIKFETLIHTNYMIFPSGSKFDKYGNLNNWWRNGSFERFQQRTSCMVKQYENFTSHGKQVSIVLRRYYSPLYLLLHAWVIISSVLIKLKTLILKSQTRFLNHSFF